MGDHVEILTGLEPGEHIVVAGNFFIDSESRLQFAGQGIYGAVSLDPVCGMEVDEARAKASGKASVYQGKTYYFDSRRCHRQFDKDPAKYVGPAAEKDDQKRVHMRAFGYMVYPVEWIKTLFFCISKQPRKSVICFQRDEIESDQSFAHEGQVGENGTCFVCGCTFQNQYSRMLVRVEI